MLIFDGWQPVIRVMLVGPLAYLALMILLRASGKRTLSKLNAFDFVVTIAIGSLFAAIIIDETVSLATGVAAFLALIGAQFVVTWLSARSDRFERMVKSEATLLYRRGQMAREVMRRVRVTEREIEAVVRRAGLPGLESVAAVILEADGSISVMESEVEELRLPYVSKEHMEQ